MDLTLCIIKATGSLSALCRSKYGDLRIRHRAVPSWVTDPFRGPFLDRNFAEYQAAGNSKMFLHRASNQTTIGLHGFNISSVRQVVDAKGSSEFFSTFRERNPQM